MSGPALTQRLTPARHVVTWSSQVRTTELIPQSCFCVFLRGFRVLCVLRMFLQKRQTQQKGSQIRKVSKMPTDPSLISPQGGPYIGGNPHFDLSILLGMVATDAGPSRGNILEAGPVMTSCERVPTRHSIGPAFRR